MKRISSVIIIYNPNSTGNSQKNAREFRRELKSQNIPSKLVATDHAGHAFELAQKFANKNPHGMVVSSSGDGGYHEVINGVLTSENPTVTTGLLPSGNANDHYRFVHSGNTTRRIADGKVQKIDVLQITTPDWTRYAHSYFGLGVTPHIGKVLNTHRPNRLQEGWVVLRNIVGIPEVRIYVRGKSQSYSHIVFNNIGKMSKYFTVSKTAAIDDGYFEISRSHGTSLYKLGRYLAKSVIRRPEQATRAHSFSFTALKEMHAQLDGEIYTIHSGQRVTITCQKQLLRTIV